MPITVPTALLVEDEAMLRALYGNQLTEMGYHVREAATADEAMALLGAEPPFDLLLSDIRMEGAMDGVELALHVARVSPKTRIILMSGDESDKALDKGMAFLLKPFTLSALTSLLDVSD